MKLKHLLPAAFICLGVGNAFAADRTGMIDYFACDFTDGLPEGTVVEDVDGAPLHFLMVQAGFDQGDSWKVIHDRSAGNYYAASPSMHTVKAGEQPVPANDRMTLPPLLIRGADALLTWRCRSFNDQSSTPSTYSILIDDRVVLDHGEAPASGWVSMDLSLEEYAGKRINITFVNNTLNGEVLAIDDIVISGRPGLATVTMVPGKYALGGESFRIGATFTASADVAVSAAGIVCTIDGQIYTAESTNLNLQPGESTTVTIDRDFTLDFGSTLSYTVMPIVNGVNYDTVECTTTSLAFMPHKRVVVEEGTGMWCGWCPLGIVATDSLLMHFGSDIIPIAVHYGNDEFPMDAYASAVGISGAPFGKFDRTVETGNPMTLIKDGRKESYTIWRGGFGTLAEQCFAVNTMAEIVADASLSDNKKSVDVTCNVRFAVDVAKADYRIALVMTEDKAWTDGCFQTNYLANYPERAPMGGYESLPTTIVSDYEFNHVARAVANNAYNGIKGSLPSQFTAGEVATFTHTMQVPSSVLNTANVHIVAMLIDGTDGIIANACSVPLDKSGIDEVSADSAETISISAGRVTVSATNATLYDLSGRTVAAASAANGTVVLEAPAGIYVLRTPNGARVIKL